MGDNVPVWVSASCPAAWEARAGPGNERSSRAARGGRRPEPVNAPQAVFGPRQAYWLAGELVRLPSRRAACADGFGSGVTHVSPIYSVGRTVLADRGLRKTGTPERRDGRGQGFAIGTRREARAVEFPAGTSENFLDAPRSEPRGYFANMPDPAKEGRRGTGRPAPRRGFGRKGFRRESVDARRARCDEASGTGIRGFENPKPGIDLPNIGTTRTARHCALDRRISA